MNGWPKAHVEKQNSAGFHSDFHNYQVNWTPDFIEFSIDDEVVRIVECRQGVKKSGCSMTYFSPIKILDISSVPGMIINKAN